MPAGLALGVPREVSRPTAVVPVRAGGRPGRSRQFGALGSSALPRHCRQVGFAAAVRHLAVPSALSATRKYGGGPAPWRCRVAVPACPVVPPGSPAHAAGAGTGDASPHRHGSGGRALSIASIVRAARDWSNYTATGHRVTRIVGCQYPCSDRACCLCLVRTRYRVTVGFPEGCQLRRAHSAVAAFPGSAAGAEQGVKSDSAAHEPSPRPK